jgi:hypothetical protein
VKGIAYASLSRRHLQSQRKSAPMRPCVRPPSVPGSVVTARQRLWVLAAPLLFATPLVSPSRTLAADMFKLGNRLDADIKALSSPTSSGASAVSAEIFPILSARETLNKLFADEETFRTMVSIGLPTGALQMVRYPTSEPEAMPTELVSLSSPMHPATSFS